MSRIITEGSVNLEKFPASRVHLLAKRFESSKATVHYIKRVAGDLQATQINLMRHPQTELSTNRHNEKKRPTGKPKLQKAPESPVTNQVKKQYDNRKTHKMPDHCNNVVIPFMYKDSNALQRSTSAKSATNMATFLVYATKKKTQAHHKNSHRNPKVHQFHAGRMYAQDSSNHSYSKESSSDESFCPQLQVQSNHAEHKQIPNPVHLIMSLAYHLKLHHTRNMYLRACLDTCADLNIMLASVYWLVFKDPEMRKIKPCKMQISTYTADTVKIICSCTFGIVHPDTKKLVPVTFL